MEPLSLLSGRRRVSSRSRHRLPALLLYAAKAAHTRTIVVLLVFLLGADIASAGICARIDSASGSGTFIAPSSQAPSGLPTAHEDECFCRAPSMAWPVSVSVPLAACIAEAPQTIDVGPVPDLSPPYHPPQ